MNLDFNAIVTTALTAAIEQATAPLAARVNELEQQLRIERSTGIALAAAVAEDHATLTTYLSQPVPATSFVRAVGDNTDTLDEKVELVEHRLADLTTILGAVYDIRNLQSTVDAIRSGNADVLVLAEQMNNRIDAKCEAMMSEHLDAHDHDEFITGDYLGDKVRDEVRNLSFTVEVD